MSGPHTGQPAVVGHQLPLKVCGYFLIWNRLFQHSRHGISEDASVTPLMIIADAPQATLIDRSPNTKAVCGGEGSSSSLRDRFTSACLAGQVATVQQALVKTEEGEPLTQLDISTGLLAAAIQGHEVGAVAANREEL